MMRAQMSGELEDNVHANSRAGGEGVPGPAGGGHIGDANFGGSVEDDGGKEQVEFPTRIAHVHVTDEMSGRIADELSSNSPALRVLSLNDCEISSTGISTLGASLAATSRILELELLCIRICPAGTASLAAGLARNASLKVLKIVSCWFEIGGEAPGGSKGGIGELGKALGSNSTLETLHIANTKLRLADSEGIADGLSANARLRELTVLKCGMCQGGASALGASLRSNTSLETLILFQNKFRDEGAAGVAHGLANNASLRRFDLCMADVREGGVAAVCCALESNTTLTSLRIMMGSAPKESADQGATHIADMLRVNVALTFLSFSGEMLTTRGAASLGLAVRDTPRPHALLLDGTWLGQAWQDLGLPECSRGCWNEYIIDTWEGRKRNLVALGMGLHPRLGGGKGCHANWLDADLFRLLGGIYWDAFWS